VLKSAATALMLLLAGGAPQAAKPLRPAQAPPPRGAQSTIIVREQITVRIPVRTREMPAPGSVAQWKEKKGPKCIAARSILGAALNDQSSVDLILRDRSRIRAKLEKRCPALDYYYGFYVTPNVDGMICADRDIIRSRIGGQCEIDKFRTLKAVARD
jgi:hypothetical protein